MSAAPVELHSSPNGAAGGVGGAVHAGRWVRVLRLDPDLIQHLDPEQRAWAERVAARLITIDTGVWRLEPDADVPSGHLGLLIIDGLISRSVVIGDTRCTELLGQGDVLRPWSADSEEPSSVPVDAEWRVIGRPLQCAVLDADFALQIARWPQITAALLERAVQRSRWLGFQVAVCHMKRIKTRLLMVLWHFADRWGRVTPDGILVDVGLRHETLAEIVGARRPSVTSALTALRHEGLVEQLRSGAWLLLGDPPSLAGLSSDATELPGAAD